MASKKSRKRCQIKLKKVVSKKAAPKKKVAKEKTSPKNAETAKQARIEMKFIGPTDIPGVTNR
jgi:hypothetical protein